MTDYRDHADRLNAARARTAQARDDLARARDAALRGGDQRPAERARQRFVEVAAQEGELLRPIAEQSVSAAVATLSDADPWLLFPVRLETRFKTLLDPTGAEFHELWLRIFPDDCVIDTYEPRPSESEIKATELYWLNLWRAGGTEDGRRAAWKGLVGSCGAGRAGWLIRQHVPAGQPSPRIPAHETLLVAVRRGPTNPALAAALAKYWPAVWAANGATAALQGARNRLKSDLGFVNPTDPGADAAADAAIALAPPFNLRDAPTPPGDRTAPPARYLIVEFPDPSLVATQRAAWGAAPKVDVLPDRFVAMGYAEAYAPGAKPAFVATGQPIPSPLIVGLDPNAPRGEQFDPQDGDLIWGDDVAWLADFDAAVDNGMGLRVRLTPEQRRTGFDRIVVVGVRATATAQQGQQLLETLLSHHRDGRAGLALLPQGASTNNVEEKSAERRLTQDAEASYAVTFTAEGEPQSSGDWIAQHDGARLAGALGVSLDALKGVRGVNGSDQIEARAMHTALFPGTLGYFLHEMVGDTVGPEAFQFLRRFFIDMVSGRGPIPALRIGAQPYGVLPTTAFSRLHFGVADSPVIAGVGAVPPSYLERTRRALQAMDGPWAAMAVNAARVGKPGDPHRILLDILGHHPASVEFHRRTMESLEEHLNRIALLNGGGLTGAVTASIESVLRQVEVPQLLASLGLDPVADLPLARRLFQSAQVLLNGAVIDDAPLSETEPIVPSTTDGRSYLAWLVEEARRNMETLRRQTGFVGSQPPRALLYLILRFAILSGYRHAGINRLLLDDAIDVATAKAYRRDPLFVHVRDDAASESRWSQLYSRSPRQGVPLHQRLTADLAAGLGDPELRDQLEAIASLQDLPTARLERLFVEHLDCLSYRVDAWRTALVTHRLRELRGGSVQVPARQGVLLGAYGWVENVRPRKTPLQPQQLPADLAAAIAAPVMRDPENQGFIHAPSLDHAVTASVLRSAHMSAADPGQGDELSIDLSSERARRALDMFEGMQEGQSLPALLGYQFERGLHERHAPLRLDRFIQPLRERFPLDANRLPETQTDGPSEAIVARTVVDGRKLARAVQATPAYPFGQSGLPSLNSAEATAIAKEADRLLDTLDAASDLAMAEAVHQSTRGNFDRAAGVLDAFARGSAPPEPEVTRTPRTGATLTHRVALHLDSNPPAPPVTTPRARVEPRLDAWVRKLLPDLASIACQVFYMDVATGTEAAPVRVAVADLGLSALDLVLMSPDAGAQSGASFDQRVVARARTLRTIAPDAAVRIDYLSRPDAASVTLFELAPLVGSIGALFVKARPVKASDLARPANPYDDPPPTLTLDKAPIAAGIVALETLATDAQALSTNALAASAATPAVRLATIDAQLDKLNELADRAALYALPSGGGAVADDARKAVAGAIRKQAVEVRERWKERLAAADVSLADEAALPAGTADADRIALLRAAEAGVSTAAFQASGSPTPAALRAETLTRRADFGARIAQIRAVASSAKRRVADLLSDAQATLVNVSAFERLPWSFADAEDLLPTACSSIAVSAAALAREAEQRVRLAKAALVDHDAAGLDTVRAEALDRAAKALFGEAFFTVPGVRLGGAPRADGGASQRAEWAAAIAGAAGLLDHLVTTLRRFDPVDEWFATTARVRAPLKHLERVGILSEGFGAGATRLSAFQLPFAPGDAWLGAEFPPDWKRPADPLLYTAVLHGGAWDATQPLFALLIDEWVETLPNDEETTGLAFHYNRPNAEPPQAWLLVAPPQIKGAWSFDDIVAAVDETLQVAKQRAVDPALIDAGPFARFLPATLFSTAQSDITLIADLAINNLVTYKVQENG